MYGHYYEESHTIPKIALKADNPSIAMNFAKQGVGATVSNNCLLENMNFDGKVQYYKILSQYGRRSAYAYYKKGRFVTAAMKKFLSFLQVDENNIAKI